MSETPTKIEPKKFSWRETFNLIKDYFVNSDNKLVAWLFLIGITLCVVGLVAIMATFSWWSAVFWAALAAKELNLFLLCMGQFAALVSAYVGISVLKNFLVEKLSILWRNWLTHKILNTLFNDENNYLDLKRFSRNIDNMSQRIQEDVQSFVTLTLNLGSDFLKSALSLGAFVGTLWIVGGALSFVILGLNIVIPGYLVWVALFTAIAATIATHFIAKSLSEKNQNAERAEADLRKDLETVDNDAENIAQEHAEIYYKKSLTNKVKEIYENANKKLNIQSRLVAFQNFYMQISGILPSLLAAPLYFSGLIELGQLMQIGMSFGEVSSSLSWFVGAYEGISKYKTNIERLTELQQAFQQKGISANPKSINRTEINTDSLTIKELTIMQPRVSSTQCMLRNLNLTLVPGEHILIKGPSGLGKSTLFKAISGSWKYGNGEITIPAGKRMYFLPQKPTIPYDTLMAVLAYPDPVDTYTEDQYISALKAVGGMDAFIPQLNEKRTWSKELSGGEQQRITFARALLKKPDWLFLDEATSALDEESEDRLYNMLRNQKDTTIVSIAHRSTVEKYHSRVVYFKANAEKEINVTEQARLSS